MTSKKEQISSFSSRLTAAFEKSNYNKSSLSRAMNVTHTTISRWLGGQIPNGESLYKLAELLNIKVNDLINCEQKSKHPLPIVKDDVTSCITKKESSHQLLPEVDFKKEFHKMLAGMTKQELTEKIKTHIIEAERGNLSSLKVARHALNTLNTLIETENQTKPTNK